MAIDRIYYVIDKNVIEKSNDLTLRPLVGKLSYSIFMIKPD